MNNSNLCYIFKYFAVMCITAFLVSCTIQEEGIEGTQKPKIQISGVVISVDGQPLIDANVLLMTPSSGLLTSGITNQPVSYTHLTLPTICSV